MSNDSRIKQVDSKRRLKIELGTTLRLEFEGISTRVNAVLVGMDPPSFLVLRVTDDARRAAARLFTGNEVVVRYVFRGTVFGFQSSTLGTIAEPARLVFIAYPKVLAEHHLRDQRRVDSVLPGKLRATGREADVVILDISPGGCRLTSANEMGGLAPDTAVSIAFVLPGVEGEVLIEGTVRNEREGQWGTEYGVQFSSLDDATREKLCTRYIDAIHARLLANDLSPEATEASVEEVADPEQEAS